MINQAKTLNQALLAAMDRYGRQTCFQVKRGNHYQGVSYRRLHNYVLRIARFFRRRGVTNGERVVLVADNSLEWMVTYMAALLSGGTIVALPASLPPDMLRFILQDSGAVLTVVQEERHARVVIDSRNRLPDLKTLLFLHDEIESPLGLFSIAGFLTETEPLAAEERETLRDRAAAVSPQALAAVIYTVGEAGIHGAVFDQGQLLAALRHMAGWLILTEDDLAFTAVEWTQWPSLAAALHYFVSGVANVLGERGETVAENMQETSPTVTLAVPYFFERFYQAVMAGVIQMPESSQEVFHWAVAQGKAYRAAGPNASEELRQGFTRADMTFFTQIRGQIGGRMRCFYSAGAPLPQQMAEFFEAVGLPVLNTYSLTEAGGFPAASQPGAHRHGACGQPAPGFQLRLAADGEVLVRGDTVMRRYWRRPEETQQVLDAEGWLHSGDTGRFDREGYLFITGRKRNLIVLSTGRKVVPTAIENALASSPFIAQAVVFGEGKPYLSALLVPHLEALAAHFHAEEPSDEVVASSSLSPAAPRWFWGQATEGSELLTTTAHPSVKLVLDRVIEEVNSWLDRREQIRSYSLLDQALGQAATDLTQAMQISRQTAAERYASQIETMYPSLARELQEREITSVQVSPERLRELLEKESILDAWMEDAGIEFLFELAREKYIDAPSMVHLCDTVATIAQMESETRPISTALIVGDPVRIGRVLAPSEIQLLRRDHIRRMRKILITLAKMVDGLVLGYVVDKHGYVRGIHKLDVVMAETDSFLLGPQFRHHAAISQQCDAVVFFVPTGGRQVRVFADGQMVGRYSNGDWSAESMPRVDEEVAHLAATRHYDLALVRRVLRCAFQMSEENLGAIFILGNADVIMEHSDEPEISPFALIVSAEVDRLSDRELINFARQDGATVVDVEGKFRGCMVLLRPDAHTRAEIGPGKGARHSSAAKMSAEAQCLAITVSQDGPITVYDCGRRVLSL